MEYNTEVWASIAVAGILLISQYHNNMQHVQTVVKKRRNRRRWWVRPILSEENRLRHGAAALMDEMRLNDHESFFNYTRMSPISFDKLLRLVGPHIKKQNTVRASISPSIKLALTLRYLASGDIQASVSYSFRLGKATACMAIRDTLNTIWVVLKDEVLPTPTEATWLESAEGFNQRWNFPNCVGAVDGKHIRIIAPSHSGSEFFNYKNYFSTILMAICDYRYRFILIDVGAQGRQSDSGVFRNSNIGQRFYNSAMDLPEPKEIADGGPIVPYYLLGDEAFGLKTWLITPYSGKSSGNLEYSKLIFNYRQSRARRVIENTFGLLVSRWRILRNALAVSTENSDKVVLAVACLHNFCLAEEGSTKPHQKKYLAVGSVDRENQNGDIINGLWRTDMATNILPQISRQGGYNASIEATKVRDDLAEYFMTNGSIPCQWSMVG